MKYYFFVKLKLNSQYNKATKHDAFYTCDCFLSLDEFVKSQKTLFFVIPAPHLVRDKLQPESRLFKDLHRFWTPVPAPDPDPGFTGVTTFYKDIFPWLIGQEANLDSGRLTTGNYLPYWV